MNEKGKHDPDFQSGGLVAFHKMEHFHWQSHTLTKVMPVVVAHKMKKVAQKQNYWLVVHKMGRVHFRKKLPE